MSQQENKEPRRVQAVEHVIQILDCFLVRETTLALTEIAAVLQLNKSSVYRLLETMVAGQLLAKDPFSRGYTLGTKMVQLARCLGMQFALTEIAMPFLERLRDQSGETSALHVRIGTMRFCVGQLPSPQPVRLMLETNRPYPLVRGATGKTFLAYLPAPKLTSVLAELPESAGQALLRELPAIRKRGFAFSRNEVLADTASICAPVLSASSEPIAAIGIHGPTYRVTENAVPGLGKHVVAIAKELREKLASYRKTGIPKTERPTSRDLTALVGRHTSEAIES